MSVGWDCANMFKKEIKGYNFGNITFDHVIGEKKKI